MKTFLLGALLGMLAIIVSTSAMAAVNVRVNIALPPVIEFGRSPELIVIPGTYVYTAPDVDVDIFFYNGWWWRPWEGRWYRSRHYDSGWAYYRSVPTFYKRIPPRWRDNYRDRQWEGYQWNYERIPENQVRVNWRTWADRRHWEKYNTWGVQGYNPRTHREMPQPGERGRGQERGRGEGRGRR